MPRAARPDSRCSSVQLARLSIVARPRPSGGVQIAAAHAPMMAKFCCWIIAAPKKNAALFTGPPMSKAIIAPSTIARMIRDPLCRPSRKWPMPTMTEAIGMFNASINNPTGSAERIGMTMIGMTGRRTDGTWSFFRRFVTWPATNPMRSAPRNPALAVLLPTACGIPAMKPPIKQSREPGRVFPRCRKQ